MQETQDVGSFPGSGRCPGGWQGSLLQYSCLGNPMAEESGGLQSREIAELGTTEWIIQIGLKMKGQKKKPYKQ